MSFGFYCFVSCSCFPSIRRVFPLRNWTLLTFFLPFDFDVGRATTQYGGVLFAVLFFVDGG